MNPLLKLALKNQNNLNLQINPAWREQNYNWRLAVHMELAELIDHFNWKWWAKSKKQVNQFQIKLELVDVFHFCLSHYLQFQYNNRIIEKKNVAFVKPVISEIDIGLILSFDAFVITNFNNILPEFFSLWARLGLAEDELYKLYFAKNALNEFRQENGYKQGTYNKNFGGKEDNEHLQDLIEANTALVLSDSSSVNRFKEFLKFGLSNLYTSEQLTEKAIFKEIEKEKDPVLQKLEEIENNMDALKRALVKAQILGG